MTFYRFMHSRWLDSFLSGESVKFGTLDEFRNFRSPQTENKILIFSQLAEELRAGIGIHPGNLMGLALTNEEMTKIIRDRTIPDRISENAGIIDSWEGISYRLVNNGDNVRNNLSIVQPINFPIFCGSKEISETTVNRMREDSANYIQEPYDICVPIEDIEAFSKSLFLAIQNKYRVRHCNIYINNIDYCKIPVISKEFGFNDGLNVVSRCFHKPPFFASQKEVRLVGGMHIPRYDFGYGIKLKESVEKWCGSIIDLTKDYPEGD